MVNRRVELYRQAKILANEIGIRVPNYRYSNVASLTNFIQNTQQELITFKFTLTLPTGDSLFNKINPRMIPNRPYYISFLSNDSSIPIRFNIVRELQKNQPKSEWYNLFTALQTILSNFDEYGVNPDFITILLHIDVNINPELINMRNGEMNCGCKIVLDAVKLLKKDKNTNTILKHIEDINKEYFNSGIDSVGLQKLAVKTKYDLVIYDKSKNVWATFKSNKTIRHNPLMILAHNNHLVITKDLSNPIHNFMDNLELDKIDIKWVDTTNEVIKFANETNDDNIEGKPIYSKNILVAYITANLIVKLKFPECEEFSECFTEGSVGKSKFIKCHNEFKYGMNATNPFYKMILDADTSGFYMRIKESKPTNFKYDMNQAYKSFRNSGIFNGFPNITAIFNVNKAYSEFNNETTLFGLVYIQYEKLTLEDFREYNQIYYEASGWYPIEIVKYNFETYGINPFIKQYLYAANNWDTKVFDTMSNQQFRSFIGKCVSQSFSETWETTDYLEFMRARFILKDRITNINMRLITNDTNDNYRPGKLQKKYIIEYKSDKIPWNFPIVSVYVKAHQKFNLFSQINKLYKNNIKVISVSVDSIETSTICDALFELNWKKEELIIRRTANFIIERVEPPTYNLECLNWDDFNSAYFNNQFIHISGAGGNGKSELICSMGRSFLRSLYTATTNEAVKNLSDRLDKIKLNYKAETMHRVFGLMCRDDYPRYNYDMIFIDECSMISNEQLIDIMSKIEPNQKLIISGDFYQLPCVNGSQIYDVKFNVSSAEYSKFKQMELTKNYRQSLDCEFFELCNKLRTRLNTNEAQIIIDKLNTRVKTVDTADYSSINSIYIAGRNKTVDSINDKFAFSVGIKVICKKATYCISREFIPNNQIGVIVEITDDRFKLQWANGSESVFKISQTINFNIGMCNTVHKAQGKTMTENVVINPNSLFEKHHLYVALTRATNFNSIILTVPITMRIFEMTAYVIN
jgi:hypothetical protein